MADIASLGIAVDSSPVVRATSDLNSLTAAAGKAESSTKALGQASERASTGTQVLAQRVQAAVTQHNRLVGANDNAARSSMRNVDALRQLSFQINDAATMALSGASAFQILATQGGQIVQVAQQAEGGFKGLMSSIGGLITPARLAVAGVLAIGAGAVIAYNRWSDANRELSRSLTGLGRDSGLTVRQLNAAADAAARLQGISTGDARSTVGALAGTGRIGQSMLAPIAGMQRDLAATLAIDAADANKLLAASFSDPVRGAELLNDKLGGLTNRTREYIAELVASGQQQKAQQVLLDTFAPRLGRAAELTSFWAREWLRVQSAASEALDTLGKLLDRTTSGNVGKTFMQEAEERLAALQSQAQGMVVDRTNGNVLGGRSSFGSFQDGFLSQEEKPKRHEEAVRRVNAELELQRVAMYAIRTAQDTINLAVERQAGMEAEIARQRRSIDTGTGAARSLGLPERQQVDTLTELVNRYRDLYKAKEAAYQRQGSSETGFEDYQRARSEMQSAQRALRDQLQDNGRGVFARDGALLMENNQLLERRVALQDQVNQRAQVERQGLTAVTAQEQARAAAAREIQNAREQGATAGSAELVAARALSAAETVRVGINHQLLQAARERIRSTQLQIDAVRAETAAMGGSIGTQERVRLETQLINDAKREYARLGLQMPQAEIDHYRRLAEEMGKARQAQAELRVQRDLYFEMQQIGRSDTERNVASQLRNLYGDQYQSQMNGAIAAQIRFNEQLRLSSDLAQDFGRTFVTDILNGKSATEALGNAFKNLAGQLIQMAMNQLIRSLFSSLLGALGGGGGGGVMSMFGLYANGAAFAGGNVIPFARGGAFTNSIVNRPTVFPMANGAGLMGEAGPEAVMPLKRDGKGRLGVTVAGGGAAAPVVNYAPSLSIVVEGTANDDLIETVKTMVAKEREDMRREIPSLVTKARRDRILRSA